MGTGDIVGGGNPAMDRHQSREGGGRCTPWPTFNFAIGVHSINEVIQLVLQIVGAFSETVEITNSVCQVVVQTLTRRLLLTGAVTCYKEIGNKGLVRISKKSHPVMRTILTRLHALLQRTCINQGRNCNPDQQTNHQQLHWSGEGFAVSFPYIARDHNKKIK